MFNMTPRDVFIGSTVADMKKDNLTVSKANHRTSLPKLINLNNSLSEDQKKVVISMGFGSMLQLKIKAIDNTLMASLIQNFEWSTCVLNVCGKSIHITLEKVKSALGIPCTCKSFGVINGSNIGQIKYGILFQESEGKTMDLAALELKLTKCESCGPEFKVLYMIFLCATVLLPKYGTRPELGLLNYLVDLDNIHTYNWCEVVLKSIVDGVEFHKTKNTKRITGCILLLQVILVTELASMYPHHGKYIVPTTPYVEQWTQEEVYGILQMFAKYRDDTKWDAEIKMNKAKLNKQPLLGEAASPSEGISLLRFIADQIQLFNGRINNLEQRFTSVESAVSRLLTNICVNPKGDYESLKQENSTILGSLNREFTQEQENLKKKIDLCNPSIKQTKQNILSPRVLNFETRDEDGSENSKEHSDIFQLVCEAMKHDRCAAYLLDETLGLRDVVIQFENEELTREMILCLKPEKWLNESVINCVAYIIWYDRKSSPDASRHWSLPVWFSIQAQLNDVFSDERINRNTFGRKGLFKGLPSRCSSISIPIHDNNHWLLCKVDFDKQIIVICDTLRTTESDKHRLLIIKNLVMRLESISKLWQGEPFMHSNWHDKFDYRYSNTTPRQPNGYDCGLYVCLLMMFPGGINRALTEEESVITRRRLASHLLFHSQNLAYPSGPVSVWVTPLPDKDKSYCMPTQFYLHEMAIGGILKEVYKVWGVDINGDEIEIKDDEDLKKLTESYLDVFLQDISIKVTWNLNEAKMDMNPSALLED